MFDTQNKTLHYSNAGHAPLFYGNAAEGSCERLKFYSPSLCLSPDSRYEEREIPLRAGDIFFIYTDGVTETFNAAGKMLSEEGLFQEIKSLIGETPDNIVKRLTDTLSKFRGAAPQNDDIAMIAVGVES
ncbi:MAG: serine/threonine-protein phosphatase [Candidatus Aminicenantes bacterium]|nr:serine/threonine-protein phosphatase [Candidatus Aminicenantes bacterium]